MSKPSTLTLTLTSVLTLVLLMSLSAVGQAYNAFQQTTFSSVTTGVPLTENTVIGYHQISWTGANAACTVSVDSSPDNISWTAGGIIAAQNCNSGTQSAVTAASANYVRVNVTATSGNPVTITYKGWTQNPSGGSTTFPTSAPLLGTDGSGNPIAVSTPLVLAKGGLGPFPTTPNGVPQVPTSTPSGGVGQPAAWGLSGVVPNAQTGTTYTYLATDRASYVTFSNAGAIAVTLPPAGSAGFGSNWVNATCDIGAGTATITPTTSTISYTNGSSYTSAAASLALTTGQCATIYSDNSNYFAIVRTGGTLTSVGLSVNGSGSSGLFAITGSPVTSSGTLNFNAGGTAGGTLYFDGIGIPRSSALLATNAIMQGGGVSGSPTTGNADFTIDNPAHTLKAAAAGLVDFNGGVTANLSHPYSFTDANSTNNNSNGAVIIGTTGTSTGAVPLRINEATIAGNLIEAGTGGTVTAGVLSGQSKVFTVSNAGAAALGAATCTVFGSAGGICPAEGTPPTNVSGAAPLYPDSTQHEFMAATNGSSTSTPGMMVRSQPGTGTTPGVHFTGQTATKTIYTLCAAAAGACNVAGEYRVTWYFNQGGTACGTPGTGGVTFALSWTDNAGAHSAIALPMNDNGSIAVFGTKFTFQSTNTSAFASGEFNIWSTGAAAIQVTNTYSACGVGTGTWELAANAERLQ